MTKEIQLIDDWWERSGISRSAPVCTAVSGGRDSMLLLHVLHELSRHRRIGSLTAAWFDHGLRPAAEIAAEADVVKRECGRRTVPLYTGRADPQLMAYERTAKGMEGAARSLRYRFLRATAHAVRGGADTVLVAMGHHISDQIETSIMRLAGGYGYVGMAGIPVVRPLERGVTVVRPLLALLPEQLERLRASTQYSHHEDTTNSDQTISRNRIRHAVLPGLQAQFPHIGSGVHRLTADMRAISSWIAELVPEYTDERSLPGVQGISVSAAAFVRLPGAVRVQYLLALQNRYGRVSGAASAEPAGERLPRRIFDALEKLSLPDIQASTVRRVFAGAGIEVYLDAGRLIVIAAVHSSLYSAARVAPGTPVGDMVSRYPLLVRSAVAGDQLPNGKPLKRWFERAGIPVYLRCACRVVEHPVTGVAGIINTSGQIIRFVQE